MPYSLYCWPLSIQNRDKDIGSATDIDKRSGLPAWRTADPESWKKARLPVKTNPYFPAGPNFRESDNIIVPDFFISPKLR